MRTFIATRKTRLEGWNSEPGDVFAIEDDRRADRFAKRFRLRVEEVVDDLTSIGVQEPTPFKRPRGRPRIHNRMTEPTATI